MTPDQYRREGAEAMRAENERLRMALKQGVDLIRGDALGSEWKRGCASFINEARAALAQKGGARGRDGLSKPTCLGGQHD